MTRPPVLPPPDATLEAAFAALRTGHEICPITPELAQAAFRRSTQLADSAGWPVRALLAEWNACATIMLLFAVQCEGDAVSTLSAPEAVHEHA